MRRELTDKEKEAAKIIKEEFLKQKNAGKFQSQDDLAQQMGFTTQGAVSHYLNGHRPIGLDVGLKFCALLDLDPREVNPGWRSLGLFERITLKTEAAEEKEWERHFDEVHAEYEQQTKFDAAKQINSPDAVAKKFKVQRDPNLFESKPEKPKTPVFVDIPYYQEAELSLGNGTIIHDDEHPGRSLSFQQEWLDGLGLEVEHLVVVKCKGDSMEPRVRNGDIVLINKDIEAIEDGAIYALNYAGDAKLKRLITRADGSLIIRSDNQNGMFPDDTVTESEADQLKIIGKAVWVGGML